MRSTSSLKLKLTNEESSNQASFVLAKTRKYILFPHHSLNLSSCPIITLDGLFVARAAVSWTGHGQSVAYSHYY